jgi:hypothetical protein
MREYCTSGSVAGAPGNRSPYAGGFLGCRLLELHDFNAERFFYGVLFQ